jgi:transposase
VVIPNEQKQHIKRILLSQKQATLKAYQKGNGSMEPKPEFNPDELDFHLDVQSKVTTYPQNWPAYNQTQTSEFAMFQDILIELLDSILISNHFFRPGRPFNDLREMIFCCVMRAYYGKSSRRCVSFLDHAIIKGYISKKPHFNTVLNYYKEEAMIPILKYLVEQSASPLKQLELDFTVDSSGFSTSLFGRWLDIRTQADSVKRIFKKAHVTSGVISNVITAIEVTPGYYADSPVFKQLVKITAKTFQIREISADKAYSSRNNLQTVASLGGIPYIAFKDNATSKPRGSLIWSRMKRFYDENREYFLMHYHKRSNAESVFSMMKRKFGHKLYSKSEVGQINEILCKALAHNICVLIQEYYENCVKLDFSYCAKMEVTR